MNFRNNENGQQIYGSQYVNNRDARYPYVQYQASINSSYSQRYNQKRTPVQYIDELYYNSKPKFFALLALFLVLVALLTCIITPVVMGRSPLSALEMIDRNNDIARVESYFETLKYSPALPYTGIDNSSSSLEIVTSAQPRTRNSLIQVEIENGCDAEHIEGIQDWLNALPPEHVSVLVERGWRVIITDDDIKNKMNFMDRAEEVMQDNIIVNGLCLYQQKVIWIRDGELMGFHTVAHEIGHALDYHLGFPSEKDDFIDAWLADEDKFMELFGGGVILGDYKEKYAEAYKRYVNTPKALERFCPTLNAYFTEHLPKR